METLDDKTFKAKVFDYEAEKGGKPCMATGLVPIMRPNVRMVEPAFFRQRERAI